MMEVYTETNKNKQLLFKANKGSKNGNALYSDEEVIRARKYYTTHSLQETFDKYGSKSKSKASFRNIIDKGYQYIPIYSKVNKVWTLNNKIININDFNPVSTISESGE